MSDRRSCGRRVLLASRTINPQGNHKDRRWFDLDLSLADYADRRIDLEFSVKTDRIHAEIPDMGGWSIPRIVSP